MSDKKINILVTGGAGFIGSHLVRHFVKNYPDYHIINLDKLTYAGNLENLKEIEAETNYTFVRGDISDSGLVREVMKRFQVDSVIHLAAESHVDRSISKPDAFVQTNVNGTVNLLTAFREQLEKNKGASGLFYHISTDEVYGSLGHEGLFTEDTPYDPRSPYAASKAASDHFVSAWHHTYGLPVVISNCSNNYGPFQFPEKIIPLMINNILQKKPLPVYGKGDNVRDWIYVSDHTEAMDKIFHSGKKGETYNVGGENEWKNIDLVKKICELMDEKLERSPGNSAGLIEFVTDRRGHDFRYAIDSSKIKNQLGWFPRHDFEAGLRATIDWYLNNREWLDRVTSGEYRKYYEKQYSNR